MSIQKSKNTRSSAKRRPAVAARRPFKVVKKARSPRAKQPSVRNGVKPTTSRSREATERPAPSKHPLPQASVPKPIRASSKLTTVLTMLRAPGGTAIADIMKATGWQQHSVRGFFAGAVRKKLGLTLVSETIGEERVYRIVPPAAPKPAASKSARRAAA